jgi:hypothetical protein
MSNHLTLVEKVLISNLRAGDCLAFSNIFIAYYQDLVLFASRFTNDLNNAEEIVQETFVRLWEEHESVKINISLLFSALQHPNSISVILLSVVF